MFEPKFANQDARARGGRASARRGRRFDMEVAYQRWRALLDELYRETP